MVSDIGIRSNDRGATVHSDVLTGHVARSVRGEIDRRTLQVGVITDAPEWGLRNDRRCLRGDISSSASMRCLISRRNRMRH